MNSSAEDQLHNRAGLSYSEIPGPSEITPKKRKWELLTPLQKYHMRHLAVTDICSQMWCEQQMVYKIEQPLAFRPGKTAAMNEGSSIHLARGEALPVVRFESLVFFKMKILMYLHL